MKKNVLAILFASFSVLSCQDDEMITTAQSTTQQTDAIADKKIIGEIKNVATGTANGEYGKPGPYVVTTNELPKDCKGLAGIIVKMAQTLQFLDHDIKCNDSFPFGFKSPINTSIYYPTNIKNINGKLPVINFVGGILSNTANYNRLATLWASYGFIVTVSGDFINSYPEMHIFGAMSASKFNKDPQSPLYGKVDMSKVIVAGHSAGGGATLQVASIPENLLKLIDNDMKIVGALPIEPGPLGVGTTVRVPMLGLTGMLDTVIPAISWPNIWQNNLVHNVPAWSATANSADHFSPTMGTENNEFAGITVAWIKYLAYNDANAKSYFVGSDYKLKNDPQFKSRILINPIYPKVKRNEKASELQ